MDVPLRAGVRLNTRLACVVVVGVALATFSLGTPSALAADTHVCGWSSDPSYKSDLDDQLYTVGSYKVGYSQTTGRYWTDACDYGRYGYYVRLSFAQWRWNQGTPYVCDLGSNGFWTTGTGYVSSYPSNTSCYREGWTHSQVGVHGISIYGTWVDTGIDAASEA